MLTILPEVDSTNTYLLAHAAAHSHGDAVMAIRQTAGRGQRGNTWESAPGENITMSILLRPHGIPIASQFIISQIIAVAVRRVLQRHLPSQTVSIKWPNDIYVADRKIGGILIQCTHAAGLVSQVIAGLGINVNQTRFNTDAPNPVSLKQLLSVDTPLAPLAEEIIREILTLLDSHTPEALLDRPTPEAITPDFHTPEAITAEYLDNLWRRHGIHPYHDKLRNLDILATFHSINPWGHILLTDTLTGTTHTYAIQEITAIL